ncbi:MAG: sodium:proton antiporter [Slackia piriformis]|uniref:Sodium:proton antiporter n=1 Tax=Slackia piriformis TaxID=626934 RepID=A0A943UWB7_9ACTN|nr:sodium:proton antiporter [Slackia piriformis]
MEAFGLIDAGAWSVVPPLLALALALITKEVYSSLTIGIFTGMVIYTFTASGPGIDPLIQAFTMVPRMMGAQIADNASLLLFLALLGALVVLVALAGGSRAYGAWVTQHVKSARLAKMLTALLGVLVFVDDYFNCMTVGAVMRPVTDRFRISHEKLAWIIDSSAAPVCIIAPVSSWAVAVGGYLGENGFSTFVASIPYNFYALATIAFVFFICASNMDFGPMRIAEQRARACGAPDRSASAPASESCGISSDEAEAPDAASASAGGSGSGWHDADQGLVEFDGMKVSDKGTVLDLVVPIATLIVSSIVGMLYVGGFFQGADFATAVGVDPIAGLCIGAATALIAAAAMYLPRGLTTLSSYMDGMAEGVKSMVSAIMILVLAWSLGGVCRYMIGTGPFVSDVLNGLGVGLEFLPAVIFAVSAFIGFSMGTSWGTIALVLPIVTGVFDPSDPLFLVAVGATLGGAVYGDHISPISDTTILSSTSAKCALLDHVSTQTPYATIVFAAGSIAYLVTGFAHNPWVGLVLTIVLSIATFVLLAKRDAAKVAAAGTARREGA